jgi:hypothetical protein
VSTPTLRALHNLGYACVCAGGHGARLSGSHTAAVDGDRARGQFITAGAVLVFELEMIKVNGASKEIK